MKEKRNVVQKAKAEYGVELLCEILQLSHSSFYYTSKVADDSEIRETIERLCLEKPRYGYRRITNQLHRAGILVGEEKVRELMGEMNLLVTPLRPKVQTTKSGKGKPLYPNLIKGLEIIRVNQVWCGDITFIPLSGGQTAYLAVLIDVFTRMICGWELAMSMSTTLIDRALDKALARGASPEIHHSDHGGQYIAQSYCERLTSLNCQISMAGKGKPWENPFAESAIGHLKDELVWLEEFTNLRNAYETLSHFLDVVYNHERPHSSLGYLTPGEFEAKIES
ncbi:MAG: IS3 family transposase [Deltaproteobacteria bacterium]|nr:IS3 family transposase [Deltaproteobacteria bacterium]